ncbi:MAG TPA: acylphosphatase [Actinomycetota bacterium]
MVVRIRVLVAGRVQGVFFRAATAEQARRAGVAGSVRNLDDGRVEAVFEGPEASVDSLVAWCRRGPEHAAVSSVDADPEEPSGERGFRIL